MSTPATVQPRRTRTRRKPKYIVRELNTLDPKVLAQAIVKLWQMWDEEDQQKARQAS